MKSHHLWLILYDKLTTVNTESKRLHDILRVIGRLKVSSLVGNPVCEMYKVNILTVYIYVNYVE